MTANQIEDFVLQEHLEEAPVWEEEEMQREVDMEGTRKDLDFLQNRLTGRQVWK